MLREHLVRELGPDAFAVSETFDTVRINATVAVPIAIFFNSLFDQLKSISTRDRFELFVDVAGNDLRILDCTVSSYNLLRTFVQDYADSSQFSLELIIRKEVQSHTLSIYFFDRFSTYLTSESLFNVLRDGLKTQKQL